MNSFLLRPLAGALTLGCLWAALGGRAAELYREPWRLQFHFTPATNWMNDPNGMVFYEGEYRPFYQYNPWGDKWGHMSWATPSAKISRAGNICRSRSTRRTTS